ncbi:hypothetical protein GCM10027040_27210 [Halomonas shantousis]
MTIRIADPTTGETVSLKELAARHGCNYSSMKGRYHRGRRDWDLIRASPRGRIQEEAKRREVMVHHTNRIALERFMSSPQGRLTTRLFKDYGRAA